MFFRQLFTRNKEITVNFDKLSLIQPNISYYESFKESYTQYRTHKVEDFGYHKVDTMYDFQRFLLMADELRRGVNLPDNAVRTSMFWLTDDSHYLGSGSVRHSMNDSLRVFGGNIGYSIRPEVWGQGLGTIQLHLLLIEARKIGLTSARLTCYENNIASQRVMEKNGAVRVGMVTNRISGKNRPTYIYEVDLSNF